MSLDNLNLTCLSSSKDKARQALQNTIFDCYKNTEALNIYQTAGEEVVLEDPCFDYNWGNNVTKNKKKTYTNPPISLEAIVIYEKPENLIKFIKDEDELNHLKMKNCPQIITIKTKDSQGIEVLSSAKKVIFCDESFKVFSDIQKIMFFGQPIWYKIQLRKMN